MHFVTSSCDHRRRLLDEDQPKHDQLKKNEAGEKIRIQILASVVSIM